MGCSDVVSIKSPRHVGGILNENKQIYKMRKSETSYAKVFRKPCMLTKE